METQTRKIKSIPTIQGTRGQSTKGGECEDQGLSGRCQISGATETSVVLRIKGRMQELKGQEKGSDDQLHEKKKKDSIVQL